MQHLHATFTYHLDAAFTYYLSAAFASHLTLMLYIMDPLSREPLKVPYSTGS